MNSLNVYILNKKYRSVKYAEVLAEFRGIDIFKKQTKSAKNPNLNDSKKFKEDSNSVRNSAYSL